MTTIHFLRSFSIRVRFTLPPSPTLSITSLRSAVYSHLLSKNLNGKLYSIDHSLLSAKTNSPSSPSPHTSTLKWIGIVPNTHSSIQSDQSLLYNKVIQTLLDKGHAYRCYCSPQRLLQVKKERQKSGETNLYDRRCLPSPLSPTNSTNKQTPFTIRFHIPPGITKISDKRSGTLSINNSSLEDVILINTNNQPTNTLIQLIQDHLINTTHAVQPIDQMHSAAIHTLLCQSLEWNQSITWLHLPSLTHKSYNAPITEECKKVLNMDTMKGYLPEAIFNYTATLGWTKVKKRKRDKGDLNHPMTMSPREIECKFKVQEIGMNDIQVMNSILDKFNQSHLSNLIQSNLPRIVKQTHEILSNHSIHLSTTYISRILSLSLSNRLTLLHHILNYPYFWSLPDYTTKQAQQMKSKLKLAELSFLANGIQNALVGYTGEWLDTDKADELSNELKNTAPRRKVAWTGIRYMLMAELNGPNAAELLATLPVKELIQRTSHFI